MTTEITKKRNKMERVRVYLPAYLIAHCRKQPEGLSHYIEGVLFKHIFNPEANHEVKLEAATTHSQ
ncbi:MAG: hypothetical protein ABW085_16820 [Sedimenticola sp.]